MLSGVAVGALVGPGCSFSCFLGFEPLSPGVNRGLVHGVAVAPWLECLTAFRLVHGS
jgi:hypothetical protein